MAHDVLIVDDEADIRMLIGGVLEDEGYVTRAAADSDTALAELKLRRPSLLVLDINVKVADQNKASISANAFFSTAKFTGLHVALHDIDAIFLIEGDARNFVKADDIVLANMGYCNLQLRNKSQAKKYYSLLKKSSEPEYQKLAKEMLQEVKRIK